MGLDGGRTGGAPRLGSAGPPPPRQGSRASPAGRPLPGAVQGLADDALRELATGLGAVATLDLSRRGRKYLPVPPEEVDRILDTVPALVGPWRQLTGSPAYLAAVRDTNREIKAANARIREHHEAVAAQEAALDEQARDVFALVDAGDLAGALTLASERKLL